jgi:hypothetical protein
VLDALSIPEPELNAARRRALLVLAAGGDPHRDLEPGSPAVTRLAEELDSPKRRKALLDALSELDAGGLPVVTLALGALRSDPELAWSTAALAFVADELADE